MSSGDAKTWTTLASNVNAGENSGASPTIVPVGSGVARSECWAFARTGVDPATPDDFVDALDHQGNGRALAAALKAMKPEHRDVLLLHSIADLTSRGPRDLPGVSRSCSYLHRT